jgi:ABC-type sugar transport system ATPase subunit
MRNDHIVEMKGISKWYGSIRALTNVNLELRYGEILGLLGDNAAGKSTLMKILTGAVLPDEGVVLLEGQKLTLHNPRDSRAVGIEMIYQDLALFNNLDVAANIFTGKEYTRRIFGIGFLDKKRMYQEAESLLDRLGIHMDSPKVLVGRLSGGQRQMVAAARATSFECKVLIMDEPTAALGIREASTLLDLIARLRNQGLSIILITHRISDILAIGNRLMVLKGGERQGVLEVSQCTLEDIERLIVRGRPEQIGNLGGKMELN